MSCLGFGSTAASRCGVLGSLLVQAQPRHGDTERAASTSGGQAQHKAELLKAASMDSDDEVSEQKRLAQERARKMIAEFPTREAEHWMRQQAAAAAKDKEQVDLFLMARGYGGVNWRRTRMMKAKYPLHSAVTHREPEMVTLLLRAGANPAVKNSNGQTPYELALELKDDKLIGAFNVN